MLLLPVLLLALATPAPKPTATNPFTLAPIQATPPPLPVIGTTRSRPVCQAIRTAVAPAVQAAMQNDRSYGSLRRSFFDYYVREPEAAKDFRLRAMDREVDRMVKSVDALSSALKSPAFHPQHASPEEGRTLKELHDSLNGMLAAQKTQLDAMSGLVATEQMRRFGEPDESMKQMMAAQGNTSARPGTDAPAPMRAFLADDPTSILPQHTNVTSLGEANLLDRDLGDISAVTTAREERASKVIVAAANTCK